MKLYNTRTKQKEEFTPIDPQNIRMYVCGPTVYDRAHIGNARAVVVFDLLYRLLRYKYGENHVKYVRNITDVDDKINAKAKETGRSIGDITEETIRWFHEDMDALGALRPTVEPRATQYIPQMVQMIQGLITRGHAYEAEGHVLFDVSSDPQYGTLSRRSVEEMQAGARVEVAPYKRNPMDFVLWKPSSDDLPGWDSPWSRGRPGWHIECSAMANDLLGESFDIHGGGVDLCFPHHENECAQSRCANPDGSFANIWMHNGFLKVNGEKMSKSLGNFTTVRDLLDQGYDGQVIRFALLSSHYRQPLDWTQQRLEEMEKNLSEWQRIARKFSPSDNLDKDFLSAISDDLNVPRAFSIVHDFRNAAAHGDTSAGVALSTILYVLFGMPDPLVIEEDSILYKNVILLDRVRMQARENKNFLLSDSIRAYIGAAGLSIETSSDNSLKIEPCSHSRTLGFLVLADLAEKGKLSISLDEVTRIAHDNGVTFEKDKKGNRAATGGGMDNIIPQLIEIASRDYL
jgi:cysteinyl-tRNA synthetase